MRTALALALAAGCAHAPPRAPQPPADADIVARSHALIDALDHRDLRALEPQLAPAFVQWEGGAPKPRAKVLADLAAAKPGAPHIATRTWSNEQVFASPDAAIFIGQALEHASGNEVHGGHIHEGWYSLSWQRDPRTNAWTATFWTWKQAGAASERDRWNDIFRHGVGFEHQPNKLLVDTVASVAPGKALDVAMGQGRNALYLASRGWRVTGVDFSDEGIAPAKKSAADQHLALDAVSADLGTYDFGTDAYDLVTLIYAGNEAPWIEKARRALKPGGLLVVEYFHTDTPNMEGFATGELAKKFAGWEILRDDVVEDVPDWAMSRAKLVRFVARRR